MAPILGGVARSRGFRRIHVGPPSYRAGAMPPSGGSAAEHHFAAASRGVLAWIQFANLRENLILTIEDQLARGNSTARPTTVEIPCVASQVLPDVYRKLTETQRDFAASGLSAARADFNIRPFLLYPAFQRLQMHTDRTMFPCHKGHSRFRRHCAKCSLRFGRQYVGNLQEAWPVTLGSWARWNLSHHWPVGFFPASSMTWLALNCHRHPFGSVPQRHVIQIDVAVRSGCLPMSEKASGDMQSLAVHHRLAAVRQPEGVRLRSS